MEELFDVVDTFDSYDDWTGTAPDGECQQIDSPGPIWDEHCYYGYDSLSCGSGRPVAVQNHGADYVVTGKSMRVCGSSQGGVWDCGEATNLKVFYGEDGNQNSGYNEVFMFFRANISKTAFQTYDDEDNYCFDSGDNSGETEQIICWQDDPSGQPFYPYSQSWKWVSFSVGFKDGHTWADDIVSNPCRYGNVEIHFHILSDSNGRRAIRLRTPEWQGFSGTDVYIEPDFTDKMSGYEFRLKRESVVGAFDGEAQVWVYDEDGNDYQAFYKTGLQFIDEDSACMAENPGVTLTDMKFNRSGIEGNKRSDTGSIYYACGNTYDSAGNLTGTMRCEWYLDDFIVDDHRIGPSYYNALNGTQSVMAHIVGSSRGANVERTSYGAAMQ